MPRIVLDSPSKKSRSVLMLEEPPDPAARRSSRWVGPRGWGICLCFGLLLFVAVAGQMNQRYARAEAAGEGDFALAQKSSRVVEAKLGYDRFTQAAFRNSQDWVLGD
jgi:hypothetical protein